MKTSNAGIFFGLIFIAVTYTLLFSMGILVGESSPEQKVAAGIFLYFLIG